MIDLYDIFQNFRMRQVVKDLDGTRTKTSDNSITLHELQDKVDHLSVVCLAMCELLEEVGFNKSMLISKIEEVDRRDGKLDGRLASTSNCNRCGRTVAVRHTHCLYCGIEMSRTSIL